MCWSIHRSRHVHRVTYAPRVSSLPYLSLTSHVGRFQHCGFGSCLGRHVLGLYILRLMHSSSLCITCKDQPHVRSACQQCASRTQVSARSRGFGHGALGLVPILGQGRPRMPPLFSVRSGGGGRGAPARCRTGTLGPPCGHLRRGRTRMRLGHCAGGIGRAGLVIVLGGAAPTRALLNTPEPAGPGPPPDRGAAGMARHQLL